MSTELVDLEATNDNTANMSKQHTVTVDVTNPLTTVVNVNVNGYFNQNKTTVEVGGKEINKDKSDEETFLFDLDVIDQLDFTPFESKFIPSISPQNVGQGLKMRPLAIQDYHRGYCQLLAQLTKVGDISESDFSARFNAMKDRKETYFVTVIEDVETNQVIGAATLVVELKFIRNCAKRALMEDVVINNEYRGKQLGKLLVATMIQMAKNQNCYKITLNCTDEMIKFYEVMGFNKEPGDANFLALRFPS